MADQDTALRKLATAMVNEAPPPPSYDALAVSRSTPSPSTKRPIVAGLVVALAMIAVAVLIAVLATGPTDTREAPAGSEPRFEIVPSPDGSQRCVRALVSREVSETCLATPGASIWRVEDTDYVLHVGPLELTDGTVVATNVGPLAVVPASGVAARIEQLQTCYTPGVGDAAAATLPRPQQAYAIVGCSPSFAYVEPYDPASDASLSYWYRRDSDDRWSFVATVDVSDPDRTARCSTLPDEPLAPGSAITVRQQCQLLG